MSKLLPVCSSCGSVEVKADAYATWDSERQEWQVADTFDKGAWCEDCDAMTSIEWREIQ